jgi:DNA-binding transcriptional LysR family regulator
MKENSSAGRALRRIPILSDLKAVEIFVAVVETHSITHAASRLDLAPSTISKKIGEIEGRAGVRLLARTTRRLTITEAGLKLYEHCLRIVEEIERVEGDLNTEQQSLRGRLVVSAPLVFGTRHLAPVLPEFMRSYPEIRIKLLTSPHRLNMIEEGIDCTIRLMRKRDLDKNMRVLAPNRRVFCAAESYLAASGVPDHPKELTAHACLTAAINEVSDHWQYQDRSRAQTVRVSGPLSSDNADVLRAATVSGLGVAHLGTFVVGGELRRGRLKEILKGYAIQDSVFAAIIPHHEFVPRRIRLFIDYLAAKFGDHPPWD